MLQIRDAMGMFHVPIEEENADLPGCCPTAEALPARADGVSPNGGKKKGMVIRPTGAVFCPLISTSLSIKVVSNECLLKKRIDAPWPIIRTRARR